MIIYERFLKYLHNAVSFVEADQEIKPSILPKKRKKFVQGKMGNRLKYLENFVTLQMNYLFSCHTKEKS